MFKITDCFYLDCFLIIFLTVAPDIGAFIVCVVACHSVSFFNPSSVKDTWLSLDTKPKTPACSILCPKLHSASKSYGDSEQNVFNLHAFKCRKGLCLIQLNIRSLCYQSKLD